MLFLLSLCFAHPQYDLGVEALKRKDIPTAQKALQSCVDDEYHNIACQWELGWVFWLKQDWSKVIEHWYIVRRIDPNYKTIKTHLPQAEAKLSSKQRKALSTKEVSALSKIYIAEGCRNITDTIRSRTDKYSLKDFDIFLTDCGEIPQGPAQGYMERIIVQKHKSSEHYRLLSLPSINFNNQVIASPRIIEAQFEDGMIKENFRSGDWKVSRRWKYGIDGFYLFRASIINFSGKKKLDYAHGKYHNYK